MRMEAERDQMRRPRCGSGRFYRLPTEAEWEHVCRGGATSEADCSFDFYCDKPTNDLSSEQANFDGNDPYGRGPKGQCLDRPTKVGSYMPNCLGAYDMHGNVWQWCADLGEPSGRIQYFWSAGWGPAILRVRWYYGGGDLAVGVRTGAH